MNQPPTGPIPVAGPIDSLRSPGSPGSPVGAAAALHLVLWTQTLLIALVLGITLTEAFSGEAITLAPPGGTLGLSLWIAVVLAEPVLALVATFSYRSRRLAIRRLTQAAGLICTANGLLLTIGQHVFGLGWLLYGVVVLMLADHASTRAYFTR